MCFLCPYDSCQVEEKMFRDGALHETFPPAGKASPRREGFARDGFDEMEAPSIVHALPQGREAHFSEMNKTVCENKDEQSPVKKMK